MIRENELRIGNFLLFKGNKIKIESVEISYCEQYKEEFNETFKPIELTEEILLKCGFDVNIDIYYLPEMNGYFKKSFKEDDCFLYKSNSGDKLSSLKYLHQLQNLYWCLCEKELEIEL